MSILQMSISIQTPSRNLSSARVLTGSDQQCLLTRISHLSIRTVTFHTSTTIIRMGGGPRTFPGGVSKWQWKRMQAKKAKQLLKARLCQERQIYEMRKRAELKEAVSELERPWEVVERAPTLFSVRADEQLKTLADRFQRPGGYDLWSERDGSQLFRTADGLPSARFFPKGVVHSIKPYGSIAGTSGSGSVSEDAMESNLEARTGGPMGRGRKRFRKSNDEGKAGSSGAIFRRDSRVENSSYGKNLRALGSIEDKVASSEAWDSVDGRQRSGGNYGGRARNGSIHGGLRKNGDRRRFGSGDSNGFNSGQVAFDTGRVETSLVHSDRYKSGSRGKVSRRSKASHSEEVYNMSLRRNGSYGSQTNNQDHNLNTGSESAFELDLY